VIPCDPLLPTRTFPKLKLEGLAASAPCVPAPFSMITLGELWALLANEMLPDALPTVVGANCTPRLLDCPGVKVRGKVTPLILNPIPVSVSCEMLKFTVPELVRTTVWEAVVPTGMLPKLTLPGTAES
jgi:hypothetical protein